MEKKIKVINKLVYLIIISFLLSCGVKGDPEEPKFETIIYKK